MWNRYTLDPTLYWHAERRTFLRISITEYTSGWLDKTSPEKWARPTRLESDGDPSTREIWWVPRRREHFKSFMTMHPSKENVPNAVLLFDFPSAGETSPPKLRTVLLHSQPVLQARWNPVRRGILCLCCGIQSVYMWSDEWQGESGEEEEMAECIGVPASRSSLLLSGDSFLPHRIYLQKSLKQKIYAGHLTGRDLSF